MSIMSGDFSIYRIDLHIVVNRPFSFYTAKRFIGSSIGSSHRRLISNSRKRTHSRGWEWLLRVEVISGTIYQALGFTVMTWMMESLAREALSTLASITHTDKNAYEVWRRTVLLQSLLASHSTALSRLKINSSNLHVLYGHSSARAYLPLSVSSTFLYYSLVSTFIIIQCCFERFSRWQTLTLIIPFWRVGPYITCDNTSPHTSYTLPIFIRKSDRQFHNETLDRDGAR